MYRTEKLLSTLWAKKNELANQFYWLPLTIHLNDTMGVMKFLWQHWVSEGQKKNIVNTLEISSQNFDIEDAALNLACFLAGVHDIGKCTPMFQSQQSYSSSVDLDMAILEQLELSGLAGIESTKFDPAAHRRSHHTLMGEYLLQKFGVRQDIASIIGAHHGKPADTEQSVTELEAYPEYLYQTSQGIIHEQWQNMQKKLMDDALRATNFVNVKGEADASLLPKIGEPRQVILSGLLIMADWIASNEAYFPLISLDDKVLLNTTERLRNGVAAWLQKNPAESLDVISVPSANIYYQKRFKFSPRDFQQKIYDVVASTDNLGMLILEAPMGAGKTEAAMADE